MYMQTLIQDEKMNIYTVTIKQDEKVFEIKVAAQETGTAKKVIRDYIKKSLKDNGTVVNVVKEVL